MWAAAKTAFFADFEVFSPMCHEAFFCYKASIKCIDKSFPNVK
jgi:hypothetical protein